MTDPTWRPLSSASRSRRSSGRRSRAAASERPELATRELPFEARVIALLPCRGGEAFLRPLFEPLGYEVDALGSIRSTRTSPTGARAPTSLSRIVGTKRLCDLLTHLYVLIPVLDDDKHYWVGDDEVDKLLRRGEGWLATHPERELIATALLETPAQPGSPGTRTADRRGAARS